MEHKRDFLCYVVGDGSEWAGICVDLDLAVEAKSRREAEDRLFEMVGSYIEDALKEDPKTCARLLRRSSPWWMRLSLWSAYQLYLLRRNKPHSKSYSTIAVPCPA